MRHSFHFRQTKKETIRWIFNWKKSTGTEMNLNGRKNSTDSTSTLQENELRIHSVFMLLHCVNHSNRWIANRMHSYIKHTHTHTRVLHVIRLGNFRIALLLNSWLNCITNYADNSNDDTCAAIRPPLKGIFHCKLISNFNFENWHLKLSLNGMRRQWFAREFYDLLVK